MREIIDIPVTLKSAQRLLTAMTACLLFHCQSPVDKPDPATDLIEFESVWQYLKAFSIHQGAIPSDPFVFPTPDSLMAVLHDTLKGAKNNYTHYYYEPFGGASAVAAAASTADTTVFYDSLTVSTGCITITGFESETWLDFQRCAIKAAGHKNIIIDIRHNLGGQLDVLDSIIFSLVPIGTNYIRDSSREYDEKSKRYITTSFHSLITAQELLPWFDGKNKKYVVIMDSLTASASEILAAAMYEGDTATKLIGTQSYGKGMGQIILDRRTRQPLQITSLYIKGVSLRIGDYHRIGIWPDIVPDSIKNAAAGTALNQWEKEIFYAIKMLEPATTKDSPVVIPSQRFKSSFGKTAAAGLYKVIKEEDVWK